MAQCGPASSSSASVAVANASLSLFLGAMPLATTPQGCFLSPLSIIYALSLALNGAGPDSTTHSEILRAISGSSSAHTQQQQQQPLTEADLNSLLSRTMALLNGQQCATTFPQPPSDSSAIDAGGNNTTIKPAGAQTGGGGGTGATPAPTSQMVLANSIWTGPGTQLKPEYVQDMQSLYQATARVAANGAQDVNAWVAQATRGMIKQLINNDRFDAILANAIYFKGLWEHAFKPLHTQLGDFTTPGGVSKQVPMMQQTFEFRHGITGARKEGVYDAVLLPYKGGDFSAVALLPAQGVEVAAALREWAVGGVQELKPMGRLKVVLPKFKVSSSMSLTPVLKQMGVQAAFGPGADFSRMTESHLHISDVVHKAVVEVDEEGTVAAAATAVIMNRAMPLPPPELVFNRPFAFVIHHNATQMPVFMGLVNDPSAA